MSINAMSIRVNMDVDNGYNADVHFQDNLTPFQAGTALLVFIRNIDTLVNKMNMSLFDRGEYALMDEIEDLLITTKLKEEEPARHAEERETVFRDSLKILREHDDISYDEKRNLMKVMLLEYVFSTIKAYRQDDVKMALETVKKASESKESSEHEHNCEICPR